MIKSVIKKYTPRLPFMKTLLVCSIIGTANVGYTPDADAFGCISVNHRRCNPIDAIITPFVWDTVFEDAIWDGIIEDNIEDHLNEEENWVVEEFFSDFWLPGVAELTEFLGAFGMYQVEMVGAFFDAQQHHKTRQLYMKLQAEAHKDYHPSDDFCWFGTGARSLASTESRAQLNTYALSRKSMQRQLAYQSSAGAKSSEADRKSRWDHFVTTYCDPRDNAWSQARSGLDFACDRDGLGTGVAAGAYNSNRYRINRDINYTGLIEEPRTLDINFSDASASLPDEEDVMAMQANLYGHAVPSRSLSPKALKTDGGRRLYMDLRGVVAKRAVAQHSFQSIVGMKSMGTNGVTGTPANTGTYLAAVLKDLMPAGTPDEDIYAILGENPSYYAQLEVLAKKIYQNPDFFANLYDKPANVQRKSVAMKAINLMLDRALYESELRQEMTLSVMLSGELNKDFRKVNNDLKVKKR